MSSICFIVSLVLWLFLFASTIARLQAKKEDVTILFANRRLVQRLNLTNLTLTVLHQNISDSILGLDLDIRTGDLFWSDVFKHTIVQADYSGSIVRTLVTEQDTEEPVGVAWDWVNKKLYWVDSAKKTLEVIDPLTGYRKTLLQFENTSPRAIVLDPVRKCIYWSAWSMEGNLQDGQIVRTSMDGLNSTVLFDSATVVRPNTLTLDYQTQTLYWIDALTDVVSKSGTDGSNYQDILELNKTGLFTRAQSFGLEFFKGHLYFGEWFSDSVFSLNVSSPGSTLKQVIEASHDPGSIHVEDLERQPPGENPCGLCNGGCSHLCLLSLTKPSGYSCMCPDGVDFQECSYLGLVTLDSNRTLSNTISIEADVNNHINSSIRDCLHIRGTIFDSEERVVSTRNVTYSDDPIIFIPIPSGKYTCSIDIITTSKLTFDSRRIPCATKAPSQLFLIVTISLSASTLVALLLGFTIGLLVLRCWITRKERTRRESKRLPEKLSSNSTKVPDPHYEELPKPNRNSIPLESNIAYGNTPYGNSLGRHSLAVSHSSETQTLV